jgi:MFS-type transporter involved in bile tolerance (Atg22 family)
MTNTYVQPLDFESIFVNHFAGNWTIFAFISAIIIATLAGRFRMNNMVAGTMFILFAVIMSTFMKDLYFVALLLGGIAIFYGLGRLIKY